MKKSHPLQQHFVIIVILVAASFLRLYHLGFQSLWLDELYTVNDADPNISWAETITQVGINQQQSPLYYFIQKLLFTVFGFNDLMARLLSAVAGIAGVYAVYLLGKELYSTKVAQIAAALTCINYYHIYYSQEARAYTLFILMAVLSFVYLVRFLKEGHWKHIWGFAICGALMVHFHFYGIFVVVSQGIYVAIFFVTNKNDRTNILKKLTVGFSLILLLSFPLFNTMMNSVAVDSTWVPYVQPDFLITYFYEYFGNTDLLKPLLLLLLICFAIPLLQKNDEQNNNTSKSILLLIIWLISVNIIPYLISLWGRPILVTRYTIAALPVYIILLSIGIKSIQHKVIQQMIIVLFIGLSFIDLFLVKDYYSRPQKTQFKQIALLIKNAHKSQIPILNEENLWVEKYYYNRFELGNPIITGPKQTLLDSIIRRALNHQVVSGFWIVGAHNEKKPSEEQTRALDTLFIRSKSEDFLDAWAQLYLPMGSNTGNKKLNYTSFPSTSYFDLDHEKVVALWNSDMVTSSLVDMPNGTFSIKINAKGSPCENEFPQLGIYINNKLVGKYFMKEYYLESPTFTFENQLEGPITIGLKVENDKTNPSTHEDRNAFVQGLKITRE